MEAQAKLFLGVKPTVYTTCNSVHKWKPTCLLHRFLVPHGKKNGDGDVFRRNIGRVLKGEQEKWNSL
jgi:hypothetical protein